MTSQQEAIETMQRVRGYAAEAAVCLTAAGAAFDRGDMKEAEFQRGLAASEIRCARWALISLMGAGEDVFKPAAVEGPQPCEWCQGEGCAVCRGKGAAVRVEVS